MKNKAFTLIELLAVIVILAIIVLIAVPIVINIIEDTNKSAVKVSTENYMDAVELYIARSELDNNKLKLKGNTKYNVNNSTLVEDKNYLPINELVEINGNKPTGKENYIIIDGNGKVTDAKLSINGYIIEIKNSKIISIKKDKIIKVKGMSINILEQTMEKGSTFKIIPTFNPIDASNQEVVYESSDNDIVTVDELGNVKAVNSGTAKITVTSKENKNIKAECNITVVISATGLTISPKEVELNLGSTMQLVGIIEPNNTTSNSLTWLSSNENIATVNSNGLVTGISEGQVTITASTVNGIADTSIISVRMVPFATDSWHTIVSNIRNGNTSEYRIGDTKEVTLGDDLGTHILRISNISTPEECSTSGFSQTACGFVIEFENIIINKRMKAENGNTGGWRDSEIREYINSIIYNSLPSNLRNYIIDTNVVSGHGSDESSNFATTDKLYLLSPMEVWNTRLYSTDGSQTRQLDYYKQKSVTISNRSSAIKNERSWWLRSPSDTSSYYFNFVDGEGKRSTSATMFFGVSPAFRLG